MKTIVKNFKREDEALRYWRSIPTGNSYVNGYMPDGRKVQSNEIEYNKDGTFTVRTVIGGAE